MGETAEGLAVLARIPNRGRDDDGMEYGPHVVAAIRGEALASLGRFGEAADVVLDAVQIRRRARGRRRGARALAAASRAFSGGDHRIALCRGPRAHAGPGPPSAAPLADVLLDGAWTRFPDRLEPLAAAARVAPRLPLARALVWSARLRQRGLAASCPLVAIGHDAGIDPVVRVRAAAALHGSFHDARAVDLARTALDELDPAATAGSPRRRSAASPRRCSRRWRAGPQQRRTPPIATPSAAAAPACGRRAPPRRLPGLPAARCRTALPPRPAGPVAVVAVAPTTRRGGLNIVGPFEGTSVEADVARRLAGALRAGGVPISTTSYHRDGRDLGSPWSHSGPSDFPFDVNLLVVHPDQMTDFVLDSGPRLFQGRYTIGLWVWDLQAPSPAMADAASMVHEVWTPTSWGAVSASSVHGGPVHCVAIPVGGQPSTRDRASLGLARRASCSPPASTTTTGSPDRTRWGRWRRSPRPSAQADGHRLVIDTIHADRYPDEHAQLVGAAEGRPDVALRHTRPVVGRRAGPPPGGCRLLPVAAPGRRRPRRGRQGDVLGDLHGGDRDAGVPGVPDRTGQRSGPLRGRVDPGRRVPLPVRGHVGRAGSSSTPARCCGPSVSEAESTAVKVRRARQVAARRFSRSVGAAAVRARLADIDDRLPARTPCGSGQARQGS